MAKTGRPKKEFNRKLFIDLIGLGCGADEICWMFRDEDGKPANIDTVSRWVKREFGCTFQEYRRQNGAISLKVALRKNQLDLSKKSAAMAIFLGKQYLGQSDYVGDNSAISADVRAEVERAVNGYDGGTAGDNKLSEESPG